MTLGNRHGASLAHRSDRPYPGGAAGGAIISHLKRYAGPVLLAKPEAARRIDDDDYDWALNDAP